MASREHTAPTPTPEATSHTRSESSGPPTSTGSKSSALGRRSTPAEPVSGPAGTVTGQESSGLVDRAVLMADAGISPKVQAKAVRQAWDKKLELMEAKQAHYFAHQGEVVSERYSPDNRTQLAASESVDRMLGVVAPKAEQKVQITYKLELPDWARPDGGAPVIDVEVKNADEPPTR